MTKEMIRVIFRMVDLMKNPSFLDRYIKHPCKTILPPLPDPNLHMVFGNVLIHILDKTHALIAAMELIWLRDLDELLINLIAATN